MDDKFTAYFERRLDEVGVGELRAFERPMLGETTDDAARLVSQIVGRTQADLREMTGKSLRPDAQLLLYLDFAELVARPLAATETLSHGALADLIYGDMRTVSLAAASASDEDEVSAHAVITAVSDNWSTLGLAQASFWKNPFA